MSSLFAHTGHTETVQDVSDPHSLYAALMHQPTWLSLLLVAGFLLSFFSLLGLLHINWLTRLLLLVPAMIGIALLYLPHQPVVTGIVLSFGFIMTFLVVFSMLSGTKH